MSQLKGKEAGHELRDRQREKKAKEEWAKRRHREGERGIAEREHARSCGIRNIQTRIQIHNFPLCTNQELIILHYALQGTALTQLPARAPLPVIANPLPMRCRASNRQRIIIHVVPVLFVLFTFLTIRRRQHTLSSTAGHHSSWRRLEEREGGLTRAPVKVRLERGTVKVRGSLKVRQQTGHTHICTIQWTEVVKSI